MLPLHPRYVFAIWSGYKGSSDKSTWPPPNVSGSASATDSPSRVGTSSATSVGGGGSGASDTTDDSGTLGA